MLIDCVPVVVGAEFLVAIVAVGCKHIRQLIIGTVVKTKRITQLTLVPRSVHGRDLIAPRKRGKVRINEKRVCHILCIQLKIVAHLGRYINIITSRVGLARRIRGAIPGECIAERVGRARNCLGIILAINPFQRRRQVRLARRYAVIGLGTDDL